MSTPSHDFTACVKALSGAFALSSKALQAELAVSLFVFHTLGSADLDARRELRTVYADAGRPCANHEDPAYQTVMRRINRSAALFEKIGARRVGKTVGALPPAAAINALVDLLLPLRLATMDAVGDYVAAPASAPGPVVAAPIPAKPGISRAPRRRAADNPDVQHVKTRHIDVAVPPGTPARELVALAQKLMKMAEAMGVEA